MAKKRNAKGRKAAKKPMSHHKLYAVTAALLLALIAVEKAEPPQDEYTDFVNTQVSAYDAETMERSLRSQHYEAKADAKLAMNPMDRLFAEEPAPPQPPAAPKDKTLDKALEAKLLAEKTELLRYCVNKPESCVEKRRKMHAEHAFWTGEVEECTTRACREQVLTKQYAGK